MPPPPPSRARQPSLVSSQTGLRLIVAGLCLLGIAGLLWLREWSGTRPFLHADGVVTEAAPVQDAQGNLLYFCRVSFRAKDGTPIVFALPKGSDEPAFAAGTPVPVLYEASDPQNARVATRWRVYGWAIVFGLLGIALFDVGFGFWFLARYRSERG